jgi:uncharacterized protein (TIGR02594 family)
MLLCSIGLFASLAFTSPATAKPARAADVDARAAQTAPTDVSARRRHHVQRKPVHAQAKQARSTRVRHVRTARVSRQARSPRVSHGRAIAATARAAGEAPATGLVAEARRWIGGNPTGRASLWCATFMNFVLERSGHAGSGSNMARSFASYGTRVAGPQVGAIAVMSRGRRGGHVGVVSGVDANGNPIIISGNHSRRVAEATYSRRRVYAYVMPR